MDVGWNAAEPHSSNKMRRARSSFDIEGIWFQHLRFGRPALPPGERGTMLVVAEALPASPYGLSEPWLDAARIRRETAPPRPFRWPRPLRARGC